MGPEYKLDRKINNSIIPAVITIAIMATFILSCVFYFFHTIINDGKVIDINPSQYVFHIDEFGINEDCLNIVGWCLDREKDQSSAKKASPMRIVFVDTDNSELIHFRVSNRIPRKDVDLYYLGEGKYLNCGFDLEINSQSLDYSKCYEITIQPNERDSVLIRTNLLFEKGNLTNSSKELEETKGTDLEEIVNKGVLWFYDETIGIYVFQYDWKIYYIVEQDYPFEDGWDRLGYNIATSKKDLLPENYQSMGFENSGFVFGDYEITDTIDSGKYRVAVRDIPLYYPVTHIDTGYWSQDSGWEWQCRICPGLPS